MTDRLADLAIAAVCHAERHIRRATRRPAHAWRAFINWADIDRAGWARDTHLPLPGEEE